MRSERRIRPGLAAVVLATVAVLVPVTISSDQTLEINDACAAGSCCLEVGSVCSRDGKLHVNYYEARSCLLTQSVVTP